MSRAKIQLEYHQAALESLCRQLASSVRTGDLETDAHIAHLRRSILETAERLGFASLKFSAEEARERARRGTP